MTDLQLVERAKSGDASAFAELADRHHRAALRAAMAALGSPQDADDAAQEAWIAARAKLNDFRGDACFRTWLLSIVWNKALDRRRSVVRWMTRLVSIDRSGAAHDTPGPDWADTREAMDHRTASPEQTTLTRELRMEVQRLVSALPARLRDPLLLVGTGNHTYEEVAAMLGQPVGTIKWRVSDARRQLRARLARRGFGEGVAAAHARKQGARV